MKTNPRLPITVLAQDPGSRNYAVSVVRGSLIRGNLKVKVITNFLLTSLITQLKEPAEFLKESDNYQEAIRDYIKKYKPDAIAIERFMARGLRGSTGEYLATMLGLQRSLTRLDIYAIPAVTWKSATKRWGIDLKMLYKETRTTPHQVDATVMGIWLIAKLLNVKTVRIPKAKLLKAIELTSKSKLKREKKK